MSDTGIEALRAEHVPDEDGICKWCPQGQGWPCPTARLFAERDRLADEWMMMRDERDEAQRVAREHHLEACESCAATESERDAAIVALEAVAVAVAISPHRPALRGAHGGVGMSEPSYVTRMREWAALPLSLVSNVQGRRDIASLLADYDALRTALHALRRDWEHDDAPCRYPACGAYEGEPHDATCPIAPLFGEARDE